MPCWPVGLSRRILRSKPRACKRRLQRESLAAAVSFDAAIFFSAQTENDTHFDMSNVIINGVAFWSFGVPDNAALATEIGLSNVQGCTQLIADKITMSDVRLMNCFYGLGDDVFGEEPDPEVPEPRGIVLALFGVALIGALGYRRWNERRY